jgi:Alpha-amylase, domain C
MKKEVMIVLSNTGSQGEKYTITIPMGKTSVNSVGTEFTDIISCNKVKIASTGDFVTTIVTGMPQVLTRPNSVYELGLVSIFIIGRDWIHLWPSSWE